MRKNTVINQDKLSHGGRILVVDDEKDISYVLKTGLENNGLDVDTFDDPESALMNFKADTYDLSIIDIRMPKMNGFELYRHMRKIDDKIEICFLTAFEVYYQEFKSMFPSMDVRHFIKKPILAGDLIKQIESIMSAPLSPL